MPTSARKSSIGGTRRGPLKAHVPFRGDNPQVGKKTGFAVELVERKSDGFERFEEIMSQADKRTPPKLKGRKRKQNSPSPMEEDEDGEMSMDMDYSIPNSPLAFFTNSRIPAAPASVNRVASSSRIVTRSTAVDFDKLPSPGPPDTSPPNSSPQHTSFLQMDQEDDEDEVDNQQEMEEDTPVQSSKSNKGKGRANETQEELREDPDVEEAIAQGLEEVDLDNHSDVAEEAPPPKKPRIANSKPKQTRSKKTDRRSPTPEGVRRGKRLRYEPLDWWRQEKVVYGRRGSGLTLVPHIKEIRRIPKEMVMPLGGKSKRRRATTSAPRSKSQQSEVELIALNPEEGWDDNTEQQGIVVDFVTREEVQRRIAFTAKMVTPRPAANNDWFFQKVFGDGDFIAAGQLIIPPKSRKPSKGTKDNTYVFYVIEGAINLRVHETSLILATGGMFMVPRGNTYFIENIADRDAKLFFTQARKIAVGEDEQAPHSRLASGSGSRRSSELQQRPPGAAPHGRSSSVGATPVASPSVRVNGTGVAGLTKRAASTKI